MWLYQLKLAFRNIFNQKGYYAIQIIGFAFALSCVILILSWVRHEKSFESIHENRDNLFRVLMEINAESEHSFELAITPPPLAESILNEFPEIINSTRFEYAPEVVFKANEKVNYESRGALVDPAFLEMFSFALIKGNKESALGEPTSVVMSESLAKKYFDDQDPLNSIINIENTPMKVTGIFEDIPTNSHLRFDFLLPIRLKELMGSDLNDWGDVYLCSYVQIADHTNVALLNKKISLWATPRHQDIFSLQALDEIHFTSGIQADEALVTDGKYVNIFIALAFIILIIACINFSNLQSSLVLKRTKEVGIRKVNGANRIQLIMQFIAESSIVLLISYAISFLLVELVMPYFLQLFNYEIRLQFYSIEFLGYLSTLFLVIVIITSLIPSIKFAAFNPTGLMKKIVSRERGISFYRKGMVIAQFVFSVLFIIATVVIHQQFQYMRTNSLNDQKEKIIYLRFKGEIGSKYELFKNELLKIPSISSVTAKNSIPTEVADKTGELNWPGKNPNEDFIIEGTGIDYGYFEAMDIKIVEGRSFNKDFGTDAKSSFILNETAIKNMNLKDPIGTEISLWDYPGKIVGIVEDINLKSLKNQIGGQIFYLIPDYTDQEITFHGVMLVKISENINGTIASINDRWNELNPGMPFEYHFLDEAVDDLYWDEMRLSKLMSYASILSVIICCLGLLGMVINNSNSRIREIGIRKINGATTQNIILLLNKNYVQWVLISIIIAFPTAWIILNKWLQNYASQVQLHWWMFILSGLTILALALIVINLQILKIAQKNPTEIIRYE